MPPRERPCVECGALTARTVIDTTEGKHLVQAICTRCLGPYDKYADHPRTMPRAEAVDSVACPECGAPEGLWLPADRPEGTVVGAQAKLGGRGGIAVCTECKANVKYGRPAAPMN